MRFESGRHRTAENFIRTKHVVAAGLFARDAGSIPAASTLRPVGYAWQATLTAGKGRNRAAAKRTEAERLRSQAWADFLGAIFN